jgi:hypothetical protein
MLAYAQTTLVGCLVIRLVGELLAVTNACAGLSVLKIILAGATGHIATSGDYFMRCPVRLPFCTVSHLMKIEATLSSTNNQKNAKWGGRS